MNYWFSNEVIRNMNLDLQCRNKTDTFLFKNVKIIKSRMEKYLKFN